MKISNWPGVLPAHGAGGAHAVGGGLGLAPGFAGDFTAPGAFGVGVEVPVQKGAVPGKLAAEPGA